jgi:hypothetical protein
LTVVESYFGAAGGTIVTDQEQRARIETYIREVEAGTAGIVGCPLNLDAYRYALGARYLTLFDREPSGGLRTRVHLRVDNADVVIRGTAVTTMTAETYHRFFEGIPATVNEADDYAQLTADRVPLSTMLRAITALRTGESPPAITPPETGTAGLASDR